MVVPEIISGFDIDCHRLFVKFEKLSTVRYTAFAEVWREMNFSLIFCGRRLKEAVCFTTEALSYIKFFFLQTNSFLRKICALYIMYGIYFKQPVRYSSKILLTLDEWKGVREFIKELKENQHTDALVILLKLIFEDAFEFSASNTVVFNPLPCKGLIHTNYAQLNDFQNFGLHHLINDLENTENCYSTIKEKMKEAGKIADMKYSNNNFGKHLQDILEGKIETKTENTSTSNSAGPSTNNDSIGLKRKLLREQSFKRKSKFTLYRSLLETASSSNSDDDMFE